MNSTNTSPGFPMAGGGAPADVFGPQFGGNPAHFPGSHGQYTLPAPPPGPTMEEFNQYQLGFHQM